MQGLFQIKASAGSGKTHTLTRRFLSLLSSGHSLQEICAITFTNAAAQEMRSRILVQLKECALGQSSELPKALARSLLNNILYTFSALQVRTIDSLLLQIVRTSSLALRLSLDFTPVFSTSDTVEPFLETLSSQAVAGDTDLAQALSAIVNALYIEGDAKGFIAGRRVKSRLSHLFSSILLKECEDLSSEEIVRQKRAETKAALHDLSSRLLAETERNKWKVNAKKVITALSDQNGRLEDLLHTLDSAYLQKESCTDLFCASFFSPTP